MAKILWPASANPATTFATSITRYWGFGPYHAGAVNEITAQATLRSTGTLTNLRVLVVANGITASSTFRTRKDGANASLAVSIASGTTGEAFDDSSSDTVSAGEEWNYQLVTGASGTTLSIGTYSAQFLASSNTVAFMGILDASQVNTASESYYSPLPGRVWSAITSETGMQTKYRTAGSLTNWFVNIRTNGRGTNTTMAVRVNGSSGALSISVAGGVTGFAEDTDSVSVAVDDLVSAVMTLGTGGGNFQPWNAKADFVTTNEETVHAHGVGSQATWAAGSTNYLFISGGALTTTTEANARTSTNATFWARFLTCYLSTNGVNNATTVKWRKNTANGNQSISIASGATGFAEDVTNIDAVAPSDAVDLQIAVGSGGTSITFLNASFVASYQQVGTDSLTTVLGESGVPLVRADVADSLASALSDQAVIVALVAASDSIAAILSESATLNAFVDALDSIALALSESTAIVVSVNVFDSVALVLTDSTTLSVETSTAESLGATLSEAATIFATLDVADTIAAVLAEFAEVSAMGTGVAVYGIETLSAVLIEAVDVFVSVEPRETTVVQLDESSAVVATVTALDSLVVALSEVASISVAIAAFEQVAVALSEYAETFVYLAPSESLAVQVLEAVSMFGTMDVSESVVAGLSESVALFVTLDAIDTISLAFAETGTVAAVVDAFDSIAIEVSETATYTEVELQAATAFSTIGAAFGPRRSDEIPSPYRPPFRNRRIW